MVIVNRAVTVRSLLTDS